MCHTSVRVRFIRRGAKASRRLCCYGIWDTILQWINGLKNIWSGRNLKTETEPSMEEIHGKYFAGIHTGRMEWAVMHR